MPERRSAAWKNGQRVAAFVLVHGAWHGAWCWRDVTPLLETEGHQVLAPDLPGHGRDSTPVSGMTLESYARRVQHSVEAASEPVVLVGHSFGGMVVTQTAEYVPERIGRLVYLTAVLPETRQTRSTPTGSIGADPDLVIDRQAGTCVVAEHARRDLFYGECSREAVRFALARLVPESLTAITAPVYVTRQGAGRVPRAFIECVRDNAITIDVQRLMQARFPCDPVLALDADHSPFLSRPRELANHLLSLA
jgi:pimeloyl-ACP methyl ester carboxylesterase